MKTGGQNHMDFNRLSNFIIFHLIPGRGIYFSNNLVSSGVAILDDHQSDVLRVGAVIGLRVIRESSFKTQSEECHIVLGR